MTSAGWLEPRLRPTPLELCGGITVGHDPFAPPLPSSVSTVRAALEQAVRAALARPPCLVSFSGGRDSSAVLALATRVARIENLPLPVPISNRFPAFRESSESDWQELVIGHLDLDDWIRLDWEHELDVLGPFSKRVLLRHGTLFPLNAHFHEPLVQRAAGGSLLTGFGGDELLGPRLRPVSLEVLSGRRPSVRRLPRLAGELAPRRARALRLRRSSPFRSLHWIRADVRRYLAATDARTTSEAPLRWDRSLHRFWTLRYTQCSRASLGALGAAHDVHVDSPFADPTVLATAAARYGPGGPPGRGTALRHLVGDLLPDSVLTRTTKASFNGPFFNEPSRRFAAEWSGTFVDQRLVDVDALRAEWSKPYPDGHSFQLLQDAWRLQAAHDRAGGLDELLDSADDVTEQVKSPRAL